MKKIVTKLSLIACIVMPQVLFAQSEQQQTSESERKIQQRLFTETARPTVLSAWSSMENPLGIKVQPIEEGLAAQMQIKPQGLLITDVDASSPAEKAGLKKYDVLLKLADTELKEESEWSTTIQSQAGQATPLLLRRAGAEKMLVIQVPQLPQMLRLRWLGESQKLDKRILVDMSKQYRFGFVLAEVDEALRAHLAIPNGQGFILTEVRPNSPASNAGLEKNDILLSIDGKVAESVEQVRSATQEIGDRDASLKIFRRGKLIEVKAKPALIEEPLVAYESLSEVEFKPDVNPNWMEVYDHRQMLHSPILAAESREKNDFAKELEAIRVAIEAMSAKIDKLSDGDKPK